MLIKKFKKTELVRLDFILIILTILFYTFRGITPLFKYFFFLTFFASITYCSFEIRSRITTVSKHFFKTFRLCFILLLILVLSFYLSDKVFLIVFKDVINSFLLLAIFFVLTFQIKGQQDFNIFIDYFLSLVISFAVIISFFQLASLLTVIIDTTVANYDNTQNIQTSSYLERDGNFGIIPLLFGIIAITYKLRYHYSNFKVLFYELLVTLFFIVIFFSGSRRGIVVSGVLILIFIFIKLYKLFYLKSDLYTGLRIRILFYFSIVIFIFYLVFNNTSYVFKNRALNFIGAQNVDIAKVNITSIMYKYIATFQEKSTYLDFYNKLWNVVPIDPESGWGSMRHKILFPLTGKNVEIVPTNSKGYLLDSTTNSFFRNGNAYSYTQIGSKRIGKNDILKTYVYCYVSTDFDGNWVALSSEGSLSENVIFYDLSERGKWQKLEFSIKETESIVAIFLCFSKYEVKDFSSLDGHVIFAYPEVLLNSNNDSLANMSRVDNYKVLDNLYCNLNTPLVPNSRINQSSLINLSYFIKVGIDSDPIPNLVSSFVSEDTTYYAPKSNLFLDNSADRFSDSRTARWEFGWEIFTDEFNWKQKIFGGGFNFLNWYGYYFLHDKTKSDWPHNPFLSILLYSGIFGLSIYCFFLYKVFYYYIKYIKEYPLLFIFFLITFFFSFFSGGSPFDPPIMGFFSILPFFIHSVHKKYEKVQILPKSVQDESA